MTAARHAKLLEDCIRNHEVFLEEKMAVSKKFSGFFIISVHWFSLYSLSKSEIINIHSILRFHKPNLKMKFMEKKQKCQILHKNK